MHAVVERVRPALGMEGILLVWNDEGLGLKAQDFDIDRFGEVSSAEDNPHLPGGGQMFGIPANALPRWERKFHSSLVPDAEPSP